MCSITGIRDFPIQINLDIAKYIETIKDINYPLDIQWGPRATAPQFIYSGPKANLGFTDYAINPSSTLRLKGNTFYHYTTQLCKNTHTSFLPASDAKDCSGELILTFKANSSISEQYVILCVPLLARGTTKPSAFLKALNDQVLPGRPLRIDDYLPQRGYEYISYATCCQQVKDNKSYPVDLRVCVFIKGLECSPELINSLAAKTTKPTATGAAISFSYVSLPDSIIAQSNLEPFIISTYSSFHSSLLYTTFKSTPSKDTPGTRTDLTSSYKCVPLDPEKNIQDNKLVVDTTTGEILSNVLKERTESGNLEQSTITPALVEKIFFIILAGILALGAFFIVSFVLFYFITRNSGETIHDIISRTSHWSLIALISVLFLISGILMGIFIKSL